MNYGPSLVCEIGYVPPAQASGQVVVRDNNTNIAPALEMAQDLVRTHDFKNVESGIYQNTYGQEDCVDLTLCEHDRTIKKFRADHLCTSEDASVAQAILRTQPSTNSTSARCPARLRTWHLIRCRPLREKWRVNSSGKSVEPNVRIWASDRLTSETQHRTIGAKLSETIQPA